ncbi:MAG TPA: hypothetical protein VHL11_22550, partial [Phototrophicaceae bacterium]|nr:hypothetical protein [Phototrophicaceae bacterium]
MVTSRFYHLRILSCMVAILIYSGISAEYHTVERVSVASDGTQGDDFSRYPDISADGRFVVFESSATNLVSGDTNIYSDIFVHDRQTGETTRVNVTSDGNQALGSKSDTPDISPDGRYVTFVSYAGNLVPEDTNGQPDIFVHDRQTGETSIVSISTDGTLGNGASFCPDISPDGRYVIF